MWFRVIRYVKEEASVEASSRTEALEKAAAEGASWDVTVLKETCKKDKHP